MKLLKPIIVGIGVLAPLTFAAPSYAVDPCTGMYSVSTLTTGGFSCIEGDKIYSNFMFSSQFNPTLTMVSFSETDPQSHQVVATGFSLTPGNTSVTNKATYSYLVTVSGPEKITAYETSAFLSGTSKNATKTLLSATATGTTSSISSNLVNLSPYVSTLAVSGQAWVTSGTMTSFSDNYYQTPGPLPMLGAGVAFGFSRKLRNRIKSAA